jgi:colanic acid/amylovoran biosynthesis protein
MAISGMKSCSDVITRLDPKRGLYGKKGSDSGSPAELKILCPGGFTWNNKGDAALTICMLEELKPHFGDAEFVLLSDTPVLDSEKYKERVLPMPFDADNETSRKSGGIHNARKIYNSYIGWRFGGLLYFKRVPRFKLPVHITKIFRFYLFAGRAIIFCSIFKRSSYRFFGPKNREIMKEFCSADAVVFVPGGYLLTPHDRHVHWLRHVSSLLIAHLLGKPVILYACSVGPFVGAHNRWLAKKTLNMANVIILREGISSKIISELGVRRPRVYETIDAAFLLKGCDPERAAVLFEKYIGKRDGLRLGISVRPYDFPGDRNPEQKKRDYVGSMARLVDFAVENHGASVYFMPQGNGPGYNDISISKDILASARRKDNITLIDEDLSPQELKTLYGFMDVFVGVRMHANIFALGSRVPVLAVAYEPKTLGIMRMLGLEEFVVDIRSLDPGKLEPRLEKLIRQKERIKTHLSENLDDICQRASESGKIAAEFLKARLTVEHGPAK